MTNDRVQRKFKKALHRHVKRQVQGLAGTSKRVRQRAGQPPRVQHEGRITHSMRTIRQAKAEAAQ